MGRPPPGHAESVSEKSDGSHNTSRPFKQSFEVRAPLPGRISQKDAPDFRMIFLFKTEVL